MEYLWGAQPVTCSGHACWRASLATPIVVTFWLFQTLTLQAVPLDEYGIRSIT